MYAWDSVVLEVEAGGGAGQGRDESGRTVTQTNTITHLQPDTAYVAKIKVSERDAILIAQSTKLWTSYCDERCKKEQIYHHRAIGSESCMSCY